MKIFRLFILLSFITFLYFNAVFSQVKNQVINNIADPNGFTLFVKAGGTAIGNGYNFREATAGFNVGEGQTLTITDNHFNHLADIPMYPSSTGFIWFFNGVADPSKFYNPYSRVIDIELSNQNVIDMSFAPGTVGILFINGVTDAPKLKLKDKNSADIWADTVDYNRWSNKYLFQEPKYYEINVMDAKKDTIIDTYKVELSSYGNKPMVFFTSGFLFPEKNQNGADFGLFAVGLDGKVIQFPSINPKLPATILSSPSDSAAGQPVSGNLNWKQVTGATGYHLQLSKDINFGSTIIDQANISNLSYPYSTLEYGTTYYWRVQSKNSTLTGKWSSIWSFTTLDVLPPPEQLYPANDSTDVPITLNLVWQAVQGAKSYHVQLSKFDDFSSNIIDSSTTASSLPAENLEYLTKYYWRVATVNDAGQGNWQSSWSFTTQKELKIPAQAVLIYPGNNCTNVAVRDSIVWLSIEGATSYNIEFTTNKKGSILNDSMIYMGMVTDTVLTNFATLEYKTQYWWRVRAVNSLGFGEWSLLWQFETEKFVSVVDNNIYNNSFNISPNPANQLLITNYELRNGGFVSLSLFNQLGQETAVLKNEYEEAGTHNFQFSILNLHLEPGVYFIRLSTGSEIFSGKIVILR